MNGDGERGTRARGLVELRALHNLISTSSSLGNLVVSKVERFPGAACPPVNSFSNWEPGASISETPRTVSRRYRRTLAWLLRGVSEGRMAREPQRRSLLHFVMRPIEFHGLLNIFPIPSFDPRLTPPSLLLIVSKHVCVRAQWQYHAALPS